MHKFSLLSVKCFLSNSTAFVIAHRSSTSALSNVAVSIACDTLNAQAVAVREYHYQTEQVMAIKEDKSFTWTQTIIAHFCRGKVMAYLFQRLAVCLRYWIALFSCQRTRKKKIVFPIYRVGKEQKRNQSSKLFSFPAPYRERKCHSAKLVMKKSDFLFTP